MFQKKAKYFNPCCNLGVYSAKYAPKRRYWSVVIWLRRGVQSHWDSQSVHGPLMCTHFPSLLLASRGPGRWQYWDSVGTTLLWFHCHNFSCPLSTNTWKYSIGNSQNKQFVNFKSHAFPILPLHPDQGTIHPFIQEPHTVHTLRSWAVERKSTLTSLLLYAVIIILFNH